MAETEPDREDPDTGPTAGQPAPAVRAAQLDTARPWAHSLRPAGDGPTSFANALKAAAGQAIGSSGRSAPPEVDDWPGQRTGERRSSGERRSGRDEEDGD